MNETGPAAAGTPPGGDDGNALVEPAAGRSARDQRTLTTIAFHALGSAACAIVPIPLLDDHLVRLTRRRMVRDLAAGRGRALGGPGVQVLSDTGSRPWGWGCLVSWIPAAILKIAYKLVRRVFRTILFWLLVKDAADAASRCFHEGYLVAGALDHDAAGRLDATRLRGLVDGALERVDTRAVSGLFRGIVGGSRTVLVGVARQLSRLVGLRRQPDAGEERLEESLHDAIPPSLVQRLVAALTGQGAYLDRLDELMAEQAWRAGLHRPAAASDTTGSGPSAD